MAKNAAITGNRKTSARGSRINSSLGGRAGSRYAATVGPLSQLKMQAPDAVSPMSWGQQSDEKTPKEQAMSWSNNDMGHLVKRECSIDSTDTRNQEPFGVDDNKSPMKIAPAELES